jgi:hypothetical protein
MREARWWLFILLIIITAAVVLSIFNAITYNKIANEKMTLGDVTPEGARALMALNIIILLFLFPLWIWYVYKLIVNDPEKRASQFSYATQSYKDAKGWGKQKFSSMTSPARWNSSFDYQQMDG